LENDCLLADIILPANTTMEVEDIVTNIRQGPQFQSVAIHEQAIEPIGESKSDYEIVLEVARKLGLEDRFTEGKTTEDLQKQVFEDMELPINWKEFKDKQYYVFPVAGDWEDDPPGFRKFYEDPERNPLPTASGKLEIYSERLAEHFPCDQERPPYPKWVDKGIMHDESLSSDRADMFPLLLVSNHSRWRVHSQADDISWTREALTCKVTGADGYKYEPVWIHPKDAEKRGIKTGDVVKVFNERGIVLCGALVWERIREGVAYVDHGARYDPIIPDKVDRGGAINTITPLGITSRNAVGMVSSGFLVDVEKVKPREWEKWRQENPAAFERDYDAAAGLRFDGWVEGGAQ
jgi:trimethylamine-N-oxide reductase (cytochrome c)